jgi:hypothetical protein
MTTIDDWLESHDCFLSAKRGLVESDQKLVEFAGPCIRETLIEIRLREDFHGFPVLILAAVFTGHVFMFDFDACADDESGV